MAQLALTHAPLLTKFDRGTVEQYVSGQTGSLSQTEALRRSGASNLDIARSMIAGSVTSLNLPAARIAKDYTTKVGTVIPETVLADLQKGIESLATSGVNPYLNLKYSSDLTAQALDALRSGPDIEAEQAVRAHQFTSVYDPKKSLLETAIGIVAPIAAGAAIGFGAPALLGSGVGMAAAVPGSVTAAGATMAGNIGTVLGGIRSVYGMVSGSPTAGDYGWLLQGGKYNPNTQVVGSDTPTTAAPTTAAPTTAPARPTASATMPQTPAGDRPYSENPAPIRQDIFVQNAVQDVVGQIAAATTYEDTILSDADTLTDEETLLGGLTFRRGAGGRSLAGNLGG